MNGARAAVPPTTTAVVVAAFAASGVVHLARPEVFDPLIPPVLGPPRPWVYGSGVVELAAAAGLVTQRSWAPALATATLAAIWVGNGHMAVSWQRNPRRSRAQRAVAWARLPLQVPLLVWAWRSPPGGASAIGCRAPGAPTLGG